jgi:hypothetical protein
MSWSTDDGGEDGSWSVISGESSLAHTGTVVDNKGGNFIVAHHF